MTTVTQSHYWQGATLSNSSIAKAYTELTSGESTEKQFDAFLLLLHSPDIVAAGVAMDHYQMSEAGSRMGGHNPLEIYSTDVLEIARNTLNSPPSPDSVSPVTGEGANHASALYAITNLATSEDSALVANILKTTSSREVRSLALSISWRILDPEVNKDLDLVQQVTNMALDTTGEFEDRVNALKALGSAASEQAISVLTTVVGDCDVRVQAYACLALLRTRESHRFISLVTRVAEAWPDNAPFPAADVRDLLEDDS